MTKGERNYKDKNGGEIKGSNMIKEGYQLKLKFWRT